MLLYGILFLVRNDVREFVHTLKHANRCMGYDPLPWRHNEHDGVSNHRHLHCLFSCWFRRRSKKTSKLRVTGLCASNPLVTGEFPAQMAIKVENVSIWWYHHAYHWTCKMLRFRIDWNERMPKEHVLFVLVFMYKIKYTSGIWSQYIKFSIWYTSGIWSQYIKFSILYISKFCIKCSCLKSKWCNVSYLSYLKGGNPIQSVECSHRRANIVNICINLCELWDIHWNRNVSFSQFFLPLAASEVVVMSSHSKKFDKILEYFISILHCHKWWCLLGRREGICICH